MIPGRDEPNRQVALGSRFRLRLLVKQVEKGRRENTRALAAAEAARLNALVAE